MPRELVQHIARWVSCLPRATGPICIPRLHLFELEDQPWFPATIRDLATDYLHHIETGFALHRPAVPLLAEALQATKATRVIDLCAGGGGPIPELQRDLAVEGLKVAFTLTDRYPNVPAFKQAAAKRGGISFIASPVDARKVPHKLSGFRTLFNSFHHFHPADALAVLRDAVRANQPIGIFEIPERTWRVILSMVFMTPIAVAVSTPFIRPFRWARLFWTYVIPLVPLTIWWDGIVSQLRAYSSDELRRLAESTEAKSYFWKAGRIPISTIPGHLTFLIGYLDGKNKTVAGR